MQREAALGVVFSKTLMMVVTWDEKGGELKL